jgi:hypothetical protein
LCLAKLNAQILKHCGKAGVANLEFIDFEVTAWFASLNRGGLFLLPALVLMETSSAARFKAPGGTTA